MVLRIAMILYHHLHSSLQKKLWCSNAQPSLFLNSSVHAPASGTLARQPKGNRLRLHCCCYRLSSDQGSDPYRRHQRWRRRRLRPGTSQ
jgi:hypothetical protein